MPILQFILFKIKKFNKSTYSPLSNKLLFCDKCKQSAILPVKCLLKNKQKFKILCYYCYNLNQNIFANMKFINNN